MSFTREEVIEKIKSGCLSDYADMVAKKMRDQIDLSVTQTNEQNIKVGASKIGGHPDLSPDFKWPEVTVEKTSGFIFFKKTKKITIPLKFLAQINLEEASPHDKENLLPKQGILYFFISVETWGFDQGDTDHFKVEYYDGPLESITRRAFSEGLESSYKPCKVSFSSSASTPSLEDDLLQNLEVKQIDEYCDLIDGSTKLLGYPDEIQGPVEFECEISNNNFFSGDSSDYKAPKRKVLEENAKLWRLLFQIDSEDDAEMMWGDAGMVYFCIKEQDLKKQDFSKAWVSLQCY